MPPLTCRFSEPYPLQHCQDADLRRIWRQVRHVHRTGPRQLDLRHQSFGRHFLIQCHRPSTVQPCSIILEQALLGGLLWGAPRAGPSAHGPDRGDGRAGGDGQLEAAQEHGKGAHRDAHPSGHSLAVHVKCPVRPAPGKRANEWLKGGLKKSRVVKKVSGECSHEGEPHPTE